MEPKLWMLALATAGLIAACGETALQRGATGAAIGAGAGEVVAEEPVVGAGVGAAAGALTGE